MTVPDMTGAVTIPVTPEPPQNSGDFFTRAQVDDLLNKARQQEKDKLYNRFETQGQELTDLRTKVEGFQAERDAIEQAKTEAEAAAKAAEEKAARDKLEAEMTAKQYADQRHSDLMAQLDEMRQDSARKDALFAREREFNELMAYRSQRMNEAADDIAPELIDLIAGNTREEIDASVATLSERTARIAEAAQAAMAGITPPRPVAATGRPNTSPFGDDMEKTYTVDDLKTMSLSEYAANRDKLLGAASAQYRQGLGSR